MLPELAAGRHLVELRQVDAVEAVGAARHAGGARILLRAINHVREAVVGHDMVELAGRLVEPAAPRRPAVQGDDGALVDAEDAPVGVRRIDPQRVIVVAAGRALDRHERPAAVAAAVERRVHHVERLGIARIDRQLAEVPAAAPHPLVGGRPPPGRAAVVGAEDAAVDRVDDRVHRVRPAWRDGEADPPGRRRQAGRRQPRPRPPEVRRPPQAAARPVRRRIDAPRRPPRLPQRGEDDVGPVGTDGEVDRAGVGVAEQRALPRAAAVVGAEDPPLRIGAVGMPQHRGEHDAGIARIDAQAGDRLRVRQAGGLPAAPAVGRAERPDPLRDVGAHVGLAGADVNRPCVARRDGDGADRAVGDGIGDRRPGAAGVLRLPHAAVDRAHQEMRRLVGDAGDGEHAPAAIGADRAPVQLLEQRRIDLGGERRRDRGRQQQEAQTDA